MINAIFNGLLTFMANLVGILLTPIDLIITNAFPDLASGISDFSSDIGNIISMISSIFSYFFNILPFKTQNMLLLYITLLIGFYTITISIHAVLKIIKIIKAIKIW